jgi:hypothetical protein
MKHMENTCFHPRSLQARVEERALLFTLVGG